MAIQTRAQVAAERAEQIRLGLQSTAVLYARAVEEEDWKALNCSSIKDWATKEFGPDRFSTERRKEIVAVLTATGMTTREIAAATGASQMTVVRDQREAGDSNVSPDRSNTDSNRGSLDDAADWTPDPSLSARQQAAREREAAAAARRETARLAAAAAAAAEASRQREAAEAARAAAEAAAAIEAEPEPEQEKKDDPVTATETRLRDIDDRAFPLFDRGQSRDQVAARLGIGGHAAQLSQTRWQGYCRGRDEVQSPNGRARDWAGKTPGQRLRELHAEKKRTTIDTHIRLVDVQLRFAQMCAVLESIQIQDYGLADVDLEKIGYIYDDLVSLGEWHTRQVSAVQGYLSRFAVRERIEKLRNTGGRTPQEAATALRLADKLERTMNNSLS